MFEHVPMTGRPCDATHPYPAPDESDQIDSMEYGEEHRLIESMNDREVTAVWRMVAANLWGQPCYDGHLTEVAADPILTTYAIAAATLAYPPEHADPITQLGFDQAGAGEVMATLREGGLEAARRVVDGQHPNIRKTALGECVAHLNYGFTALRLDLGARFYAKD